MNKPDYWIGTNKVVAVSRGDREMLDRDEDLIWCDICEGYNIDVDSRNFLKNTTLLACAPCARKKGWLW